MQTEPTWLYSVAMNRLGADRPSLSGLLRAAGAESGADLPPLSPSQASVRMAGDGLKSPSGAPLGWRLMRHSLVAAGRPGLSARLVPTVAGRARAVGGALAWGRASFNKVYAKSGPVPLPRTSRRSAHGADVENFAPDFAYTPYLLN